jgi:hypothetical protein
MDPAPPARTPPLRRPGKPSRPATFGEAGEETLEMAHAAAAFLHRRRRILGLDEQTATDLDTLRAGITAELADRATAKAQAADDPAGEP